MPRRRWSRHCRHRGLALSRPASLPDHVMKSQRCQLENSIDSSPAKSRTATGAQRDPEWHLAVCFCWGVGLPFVNCLEIGLNKNRANEAERIGAIPPDKCPGCASARYRLTGDVVITCPSGRADPDRRSAESKDPIACRSRRSSRACRRARLTSGSQGLAAVGLRVRPAAAG